MINDGSSFMCGDNETWLQHSYSISEVSVITYLITESLLSDLVGLKESICYGRICISHIATVLDFLNMLSRKNEARRMRWAGQVPQMGEKKNAYRILVGNPEGKRPL
jgi:hypothetical protein